MVSGREGTYECFGVGGDLFLPFGGAGLVLADVGLLSSLENLYQCQYCVFSESLGLNSK